MNEYAPQVLIALGKKIAAAFPGAQFSGVLGNRAHTYGYHRARAVLPGDDYSVQLENDRRGDKWAASAIDVTFPAAAQKLVTKRLIAAVKRGDRRLRALREFLGTVDGVTVVGRDVGTRREITSDDRSHLWHVHLSILRRFANDAKTVGMLLAVIKGDTEEMPLNKKDVETIRDADVFPAPTEWIAANPNKDPNWTLKTYLKSIRDKLDKIDKRLDKIEGV